MSHASGEVFAADGSRRLGWFEYNGTVDVACSRIFDTHEELQANWRKDAMRKCDCGQSSVEVVLYSSYGYGFYWTAKACLQCKAIVDHREPSHYSPGPRFPGDDSTEDEWSNYPGYPFPELKDIK